MNSILLTLYLSNNTIQIYSISSIIEIKLYISLKVYVIKYAKILIQFLSYFQKIFYYLYFSYKQNIRKRQLLQMEKNAHGGSVENIKIGQLLDSEVKSQIFEQQVENISEIYDLINKYKEDKKLRKSGQKKIARSKSLIFDD